MRELARIKRICKLLERYWFAFPDWRLGQLLINAIGSEELWFIEDSLWEEALIIGEKDSKKVVKKVVKKTKQSLSTPYKGFHHKNKPTTEHW